MKHVMRYVRWQFLVQDSKDIPDGQIFTVYQESPSSAFLITEEKPRLWAFCVKINKKFCTSKWKTDGVNQVEVKKSLKQVQFARDHGWSSTGSKQMDEVGQLATVYQCLYCHKTTQWITGPCSCRTGKETVQKILSPLDSL